MQDSLSDIISGQNDIHGLKAISINLNNACNMACRYCFLGEKGRGETPILDDILDFVMEQRVREVYFFAAEPFVSKSILIQALEKLQPYPTLTSVTTNLTLLDFDIIECLKCTETSLLVSYDGLAHDQYRISQNGSRTSQIVRRNMEKLVDNKIPFGIACTLVPENLPVLYETYLDCAAAQPAFVAFNRQHHVKVSVRKIRKQYYNFIARYVEEHTVPEIFTDRSLEIVGSRKRVNRLRWTCGACQGSIGIDLDGSIYPCHRGAPLDRIGTIYEGIEREKFLKYNKARWGKCNQCVVYPCGTCYVDFLSDDYKNACDFEHARFNAMRDYLMRHDNGSNLRNR